VALEVSEAVALDVDVMLEEPVPVPVALEVSEAVALHVCVAVSLENKDGCGWKYRTS
jgi:hypothetical protein